MTGICRETNTEEQERWDRGSVGWNSSCGSELEKRGNLGMDKNVVFKYYITAIKEMCYLNKVIKVNYY
jgi:hypothetical protein